MINLAFPAKDDEERTRRFQVHKNYLCGVEQFLLDDCTRDGVLATVVARQRALPGHAHIQARPPLRGVEVRRYLTLSWAGLIQLHLVENQSSAVLRYANAWSPIHAYYASCMSLHAWLSSMGMAELIDDHAATLRTIGSKLKQTSVLPAPWSVTCTGCPQLKETIYDGLPIGADAGRHIEVLSNPSLDDFWSRYCTMLRTTRERRLDAAFRRWARDNGRKNTMADEKRAIAAKVAPTSMFDFLWRLRVKLNYRDVETFLLAQVGASWHRELYRALLTVTDATTILLESLVLRQVGRKFYFSVMDDFFRENVVVDGSPAGFLRARREVLEQP